MHEPSGARRLLGTLAGRTGGRAANPPEPGLWIRLTESQSPVSDLSAQKPQPLLWGVAVRRRPREL